MNCWSNQKIGLLDVSYYSKKEHVRQDLIHLLLLPNSATKLYEPHVHMTRNSDNVSK